MLTVLEVKKCFVAVLNSDGHGVTGKVCSICVVPSVATA
jgi:hypothetical protein